MADEQLPLCECNRGLVAVGLNAVEAYCPRCCARLCRSLCCEDPDLVVRGPLRLQCSVSVCIQLTLIMVANVSRTLNFAKHIGSNNSRCMGILSKPKTTS